MVLASALVFALLGPPPPELPEPELAPVEGPLLPPTPEPSGEAAEDPEPSEGGSIEFAVPPPELTGDPGARPTLGDPTYLPPPEPEAEPLGQAPTGGGSWIAGGAFLVPYAAYGIVLLLEANRRAGYSSNIGAPSIIVAGSALIAGGVAMTGVGVHRQLQLRKWARIHRVQALPQGGALLTLGMLSLLGGPAMILSRHLLMPPGDVLSLGFGIAMTAAAPIQIAIGSYFTHRWRTQGGWRKIHPRVTIGPTSVGLDLRF